MTLATAGLIVILACLGAGLWLIVVSGAWNDPTSARGLLGMALTNFGGGLSVLRLRTPDGILVEAMGVGLLVSGAVFAALAMRASRRARDAASAGRVA